MATNPLYRKRKTVGQNLFALLVEAVLFIFVSAFVAWWVMLALGNAHLHWSEAIPAVGFWDTSSVTTLLILAANSVIRHVVTEKDR